MNNNIDMCPNHLVAYLGKSSKEFTKADIIRYIEENQIRMVNFMYPAGDGRLKLYSPAASVLTAQVFSLSSRLEAATSMCCHVSARLSLTRLQKYLP